jgi:hypothetical protein
MDYALLLLIALVLGGGVSGGLLTSWSCHRRQLALEQLVKTLQLSYDVRMDKLEAVVTSRIKTEAAKSRWSKKEAEDLALAQALTKEQNGEVSIPAAWQASTWGN